MGHPKQHIKVTTAILLITLQLTSSDKANARPVYEVINEQSRIDDNIRISSSPGILPYGNPLAGNSKQNARLHASNQQAMFNAERIRQHKAQLQRQTSVPRVIDSYMKAYHESQESHQLALEQQQATIKDIPVTNAPMRSSSRQKQRVQIKKRGPITLGSGQDLSKLNPIVTNRGQSRRQNLPKRATLSPGPEPTKITKDDAIQSRNRNYRSYGAADYQQYLEPPRYKTVYVSPVPNYEEGVTIKPNGDVGLAHLQAPKAPSKLYTETIPNDSKYIYPKQYMQNQNLKSAQNIEALNSLLNKSPVEQLSEFNALLTASNEDSNKQMPIDLFFYLKDPKTQTLSQQYEQLKYAQNPIQYANAGGSAYKIRDHTPITEEVDDIENPIEDQPQQYYTQPLPPIKPTTSEVSTTKSNNYYKIEVASQTVTGPKSDDEYSNDPTYQISHYGPSYGKLDDTKSEQYLHMNSKPTGVQHLSGDGTEVSAYGDDNVSMPKNRLSISIHIRSKRSKLDTSPFIFTDEKTTTQPSIANYTDTPTSESLIRLNPFSKKRVNDFNVFLSPNFPIGEAMDYNDDYDYPQLNSKRLKQKLEPLYEEDDYYDDFSSPEYEFKSPKQYQNYPTQYQSDPKGYPSKFRHFRRTPGISQLYGNPPATSYGIPLYGTSVFSSAQTFLPPKLDLPSVNHYPNIVEPVYMLTQTQLKELVGHHNLNIEHLDVYQLAKENKGRKYPLYYPRKHHKRYPFRHLRNNLYKLNKLNL